MSYDLVFWREQIGVTLDASAVLCLNDTQKLPGLVPMPMTEVEAAFLMEFPEASIGGANIDWEGAGSYFQVGYTFADERHVSTVGVSCGYELLKVPGTFNRLWCVADALGCRYYDLQQPELAPALERMGQDRGVWSRLRRLFGLDSTRAACRRRSGP